MAETDDPRLDLPGSTTPPIDGVRWLWVKLGAWGVAIGLILLLAFVAAVAIDHGVRRVDGGFDRIIASVREVFENGREEDLLEVRAVRTGTPPTERGAEVAPDGGVVRPPTWTRLPRPEFPAAGARANTEEAAVVLECQALTSGRARYCRVLSEDPPGQGFGKAALAAMEDARLSPREVDGRPVDASFRFTVRFRLS